MLGVNYRPPIGVRQYYLYFVSKSEGALTMRWVFFHTVIHLLLCQLRGRRALKLSAKESGQLSKSGGLP